jgi:AhpD family alkylhydroperoxidase
MISRVDYGKTSPDGMAAMRALENYVRQCGLDPSLLELVRLRASQINGCACCVDTHTKDARAALRRKADRPVVFLAGGIGITPFHSIVRQATYDKAPHPIWLFYSNRRPEDAPFLGLFEECAKVNPRFHFIATMTQIEKSRRNWTGGTGFVTRSLLAQYLPAMQGPIYYLAGPPAMVAAMRHVVADAEVDEDDIRTEEFSGY